MTSAFRAIASYLGFYTTEAPVTSTSTDSEGVLRTTVVEPATQFVTPDVIEVQEFIGIITLGGYRTSSTTNTQVGVDVASFNDFPLHSIDFNPPLASYTVSRIKSVVLRAPPLAADVNWFAGIWATTPTTGRTYDAIRRRAPNVSWIWRSNLTVQQPAEFTVPWPNGKPIADSLHAVMPGLFRPSLQIGCQNGPPGTASKLPAGSYEFMVHIVCEVAGRGLIGSL